MTPTAKPNMAFELFLLVLLAFLWGSSYSFMKIAVETIPPFSLIAFRVSLAVLLLAIMAWQKERLPRSAKMWGLLLVQSFLNAIASWTLLAWGQQYVDSGLAGVLNSTSPLFVFFITFVLGSKENASWLKLVGATSGLVGVVLIIGVDVLAGLGTAVLAQLAILAGAVLYAFAAIFGRNFSGQAPVVTATCTVLWGVIFMVPLALFLDKPWTLNPSTVSLAAATAMTVLSTVCAFLIYFRLLKTLGAMGTASQAYLRAGISVVLGIVLLGETLTLVVGLGVALAILGVVAINLPRRS